MDTRKVTLIATIAVIALVAVGIGYAYTAATSNSGNSVTTEYVTLTQGETGQYQFADNDKIVWNTDHYRTTTNQAAIDAAKEAGTEVPAAVYSYSTAFWLSDATIDLCGVTVAPVGETFTLNATVTGGTALATATGKITSENFATPVIENTDDQSAIILLRLTTASETPEIFKLTSANTFQKYVSTDFTGNNEFTLYRDGDASSTTYKPITVEVFYGFTTGQKIIVTTSTDQHHTGPSATPITNGKLTFQLVTDAHNGVIASSLTVAGGATAAVTVGNTVDKEITTTPAVVTDGTLTAVSSDTSIATVSVSGNVVTITGVAGGSTTVTVTAVGGATVDIAVTVSAS